MPWRRVCPAHTERKIAEREGYIRRHWDGCGLSSIIMPPNWLDRNLTFEEEYPIIEHLMAIPVSGPAVE